MLQQPILCPVIRDGSFIFPVFSFFLLHWLTCFLTTNIANKLKLNFISQSDRYAYYKVNTQHISAKFGKNLITYLLTKYICKYLLVLTKYALEMKLLIFCILCLKSFKDVQTDSRFQFGVCLSSTLLSQVKRKWNQTWLILQNPAMG